MYKFQVGDELFLHEDNSPVRVIKAYPTKPKKQPSYKILHYKTNKEINIDEIYLYKSDKIFPNSYFRESEIVCTQPEKRGEKSIKYEILKIKERDGIISYKCADKDGNVKKLYKSQLYHYDYQIIVR